VYANKSDVAGALDDAALTEALALHDIKTHNWHLQRCCALTGTGLVEGLTWITKTLTVTR
jgi:ADP-ribosylation factor-like protein 5B